MNKHKEVFVFDPRDLSAMRRLMDLYGDTRDLKIGVNENGEDTQISISRDCIRVTTMQHNGWVRKNTYWRDGTREETFDGRWRDSHTGV